MTRKELATEIYRIDEQKTPHKCNEKEWVKRALNGIAGTKGFLKDELMDMYNRRINNL
jgi:hypothetical protein